MAWQNISTAPKDRPILVRGGYIEPSHSFEFIGHDRDPYEDVKTSTWNKSRPAVVSFEGGRGMIVTPYDSACATISYQGAEEWHEIPS